MKKLLLLIGIGILAVVSVVIFRAVSISSRQVESIPAENIILDTNVLADTIIKGRAVPDCLV